MCKVLIADNDGFFLKCFIIPILTEVLKKNCSSYSAYSGQELDVITASNGYEALLLFAEKKPDIVITEFDIPMMNGKQLLAQINGRHKTESFLMGYDKTDTDTDIKFIHKKDVFKMFFQGIKDGIVQINNNSI